MLWDMESIQKICMHMYTHMLCIEYIAHKIIDRLE